MSSTILTLLSIAYLLFLFYVAFIAEKFKFRKHSIINNPLVFSLSLAVYCSAWTFYGSVGQIRISGLGFLAIYLGPTLAMLLGWTVLRKIHRIAQVHAITSIADFVSTRYGKSKTLGVVVTICALLAGIPYIGLQIKAISNSIHTLTNGRDSQIFLSDPSFYIVLLLIVFTVLFGTRKIQPDERHEGMVFAIAVESIIKLIAFLTVGICVTYIWQQGLSDVFTNYFTLPAIQKSFNLEQNLGYGNWFMYILISGFAFFLLPRQFQVAIVENQNENNFKQAIWLFPLYLFLIIIFVIPIAISGVGLFGINYNADQLVLDLPLHFSSPYIALVAYLGGFAAATGMIIVECTAISTMVTNSIILPGLFKSGRFIERYKFKTLFFAVWIRRITIITTIMVAYIYFKYLPSELSLVSMGLISFVAVAQFAPAILGGIWWKELNKKGVLWGIVTGGCIWFFGLVIPSLLPAFPALRQGVDSFYELFSMFSIQQFDQISNVAFWSLLTNAAITVSVSMSVKASSLDMKQALLFVDIFGYSTPEGKSAFWKGKAKNENLSALLASFLGRKNATIAIAKFAKQHDINTNEAFASPITVNFVESTLSQFVGTSTANILVSSVSKEEVVTVEEVLEVLRRSETVVEQNQELEQKTWQLELLSGELKKANDKLEAADAQKDDFIRTVTHEFRTPLTAIKSLTEIINDHDDLSTEEKGQFLETIIEETDRLSRMVNEILEIEKYESGKQILNTKDLELKQLGEAVKNRLLAVAKEKNIHLLINTSEGSLVADRDKLMQMLLNLVSNAIKFTPEGGKIVVDMETHAENCIFEVQDNGIGIPVEKIPYVFEKFYQAGDLKSNKVKGSGLGLAIVKKIVEIHQGKIEIQSTVGTLVTVYIPIKRHHSEQ